MPPARPSSLRSGISGAYGKCHGWTCSPSGAHSRDPDPHALFVMGARRASKRPCLCQIHARTHCQESVRPKHARDLVEHAWVQRQHCSSDEQETPCRRADRRGVHACVPAQPQDADLPHPDAEPLLPGLRLQPAARAPLPQGARRGRRGGGRRLASARGFSGAPPPCPWGCLPQLFLQLGCAGYM